MIDPQIMKALRSIGSEWQKGSMHRVYFNRLHQFYGLELEYYNSGNISAAYLDGDKISNSYGAQIDTTLRFGKVWFDVKAEKFMSQNLSDRDAKKLFGAIKSVVDAAAVEIDEQEICK